MGKTSFQQYLDTNIKNELKACMIYVRVLQQMAETEEERKLAENIFYAVDNALDVANNGG